MPVPTSVLPVALNRNGAVSEPTTTSLLVTVQELVGELIVWATSRPGEVPTFAEVEGWLIPRVMQFGCLLLALFVATRSEHQVATLASRLAVGETTLRRGPLQARNLTTFFGVIRYRRLYFVGPLQSGHRTGFHPLDRALGLTTDRMSLRVLSLCARLAVNLSFAETHATLARVLPSVPAPSQIERAVLGLGRFTRAWLSKAPVPTDDGEVLVMQFDSKGAPTATDQELTRRRGPRRRSAAPSPRHRGVNKRSRYGSKRRREPGDKSKNARMATRVVMYTLRREGDLLLGPLNKRVYASFASKEHAFQWARTQADRRGFSAGSGRLIQALTDGELCFDAYLAQYFPEALRTLDIVHVIEKLWTAAEAIFRNNTLARNRWVELRKKDLLEGREAALVTLLEDARAVIPKTGPGNKGRRHRLADVASYLRKRLGQLRYQYLMEQDLELATGAVEGGIKDIVGRRFDHGGMRWVPARAEALLHLRCIEANGEWDAFVAYVQQRLQHEANQGHATPTLLRAKPLPIPTVYKVAA